MKEADEKKKSQSLWKWLVFVVLILVLAAFFYLRLPVSLRNKIPVVAYHYITSSEEAVQYTGSNLQYALDVNDFERHLIYLKENGFTTISPDQLIIYLGAGKRNGDLKSLPLKPIILTFDDGRLDVYKYAFPLLKKYGMSAYLFLTAGIVGDPNFISYEQAQEMTKNGIYFGSHSLTHPVLTDLSDEEVRQEMALSKIILENKLDIKVQFFSVPLGVYDRRVIEITKETGYMAVFTSDYGVFNWKKDGSFKIQRLAVKRADKSLKNMLTRGKVLLNKIHYGITGLFKNVLGFDLYRKIRLKIFEIIDDLSNLVLKRHSLAAM